MPGMRLCRTERVLDALVPGHPRTEGDGTRGAPSRGPGSSTVSASPRPDRSTSSSPRRRRGCAGRPRRPGTDSGSNGNEPRRSGAPRRSPTDSKQQRTAPNSVAACSPSPASALGPRPRSRSSRSAIPMRSASATTTSPTLSRGRSPASRVGTTIACSSCSRRSRPPGPRRPPHRSGRHGGAPPWPPHAATPHRGATEISAFKASECGGPDDDLDVTGLEADAGDQGAALLDMYDRALPRCTATCAARTRNTVVAEDLASETFLAAVAGRAGATRCPTSRSRGWSPWPATSSSTTGGGRRARSAAFASSIRPTRSTTDMDERFDRMRAREVLAELGRAPPRRAHAALPRRPVRARGRRACSAAPCTRPRRCSCAPATRSASQYAEGGC